MEENNTKQRLFFVRHGQTKNNLENRMNTGDDNDPLTDIGKQQASKAGKDFCKSGIFIDVIITSRLDRAFETGRIIAKEIGYSGDIYTDSRLREQDGGIFKGAKRDDIKEKYHFSNDIEFRKLFKNKKYNQIEDVKEFDSRVSEAYNDILKKYPEKNVLIVGHSGTSRPLLRNAQNLNFDFVHYEMKGLKNAQIIELATYKNV